MEFKIPEGFLKWWQKGRKKQNRLNAFAFTTQITPSLIYTNTRILYILQLCTSSIKVLLQLSIRKLSLGFRALAYRHLYEAFFAKCSKRGPAICIEFKERGGRGWGDWAGHDSLWSLVVLGEGRRRRGRRGKRDDKCINLQTRLFGSRWIYIPLKSNLPRWVKSGLLRWYLWTSEPSLSEGVCVCACKWKTASYGTQCTANSSTLSDRGSAVVKRRTFHLLWRGKRKKRKKRKKDEIMEKAHFLLNLDSGFPNKIAFILHNMCSQRLRPCNLAKA